MNATVKDKLLFGQMIMDGFERSTILFFQRMLPLMMEAESFSPIYLERNGAFMTAPGCRRHLKALEQRGYIVALAEGRWKLAQPILRDKELAIMALVFLQESTYKYGVREYA